MDKTERYSYGVIGSGSDGSTPLPFLPITLRLGTQSVGASGLLDTGASVNVLPYSLGIQLGAVWSEQRVPLRLTGNLANFEARALLLDVTIGSFPPVRLAFAWTQAEEIPLILGQVNFFAEFDVCFYASPRAFEVRPRKQS